MGTVAGHPKRIEAALARMMAGLAAKEFAFVTPEATSQHLQRRLARFDEGRANLSGQALGLGFGLAGAPVLVTTLAKQVVGFGAEQVADEELAALQRLMRTHFPLCAIAFSRLYGPRFVAIVDGDAVAQQALHGAMDRFQEINLYMLQLGGRLSLKLFGRAVAGIRASAATGSLILVAGSGGRAELLRQWAAGKPLHSDTIVTQMKERFSSVSFWAKAVVGFIEYKPHQLRQEVIVLDAESGRATSTAAPRLAFEFGFSLGDIAAAGDARLPASPARG